MTPQSGFLKTTLAALASPGAVFGPGRTAQPDPAMASLGQGFVSATAHANGTTLRYVRGGTGPAVILLHGFPGDWSEFRKLMPRLAAKFTVVAVDLRGVGGSAPTPEGYDAATMAQDTHELAQQLQLEPAYIAGHDIGGIVAYAFARLYPTATRGVMILDVPLPGIAPWEEVKRDPLLWHFGFHQTAKVPEELISGREFAYFRDAFFERWAFNKSEIAEGDIAHYARSYGTPEQLRAGMAFYRAFPAAAEFNDAHRERIDVPIALVGGDHAVGSLEPKIAQSLRMHGCTDVTIDILADSGHFVADEQPAALAALVEHHAG